MTSGAAYKKWKALKLASLEGSVGQGTDIAGICRAPN